MRMLKLHPLLLLALILSPSSWAQEIAIKQDLLPQAIKFMVPTDVSKKVETFVFNKLRSDLRQKHTIYRQRDLYARDSTGVVVSKPKGDSLKYVNVIFFTTASMSGRDGWASNRFLNFKLIVSTSNLGNNKSEFEMKLSPIATQGETDSGARGLVIGGGGSFTPPNLPNTFDSYLKDIIRLFTPFEYTVPEKKSGRIMFAGDEDRVISNIKNNYSILSERKLRRTYSLLVEDKKLHTKLRLSISKRKENILVKYQADSANSICYLSDSTVKINYNWSKLKARVEHVAQL